MKVLKPMHRDRQTPIWENNDIKEATVAKIESSGELGKSNTEQHRNLRRKKSEKSKKFNKKQYTLEFLVYLKIK